MNFSFFQKKEFQIFLLLSLFSLFCLGLIFFRVWYSDSVTYVFLLWNLFLAWIPFGCSFLFTFFEKKKSAKKLFLFFFVFWLLFFPNAPYILTDLFHLEQKQMIPLWFDLILILSFAMNGLFLGFFSLSIFQNFLRKSYSTLISWIFVLSSLLLASYGVYLGRYLRWNSWDIISAPGQLFSDIFEIILHPTQYPGAYGMTFLFFIFLLFFYVLMRILEVKKD